MGGAPLSGSQQLPGLRLSPPGVKVEHKCQPLWLGDYSFNKINSKMSPLTYVESMKYGCALYWLLREIVLADTNTG